MAEPAMKDLKNGYSKQIIYSKTATEEKIFIYYPDVDAQIETDQAIEQ